MRGGAGGALLYFLLPSLTPTILQANGHRPCAMNGRASASTPECTRAFPCLMSYACLLMQVARGRSTLLPFTLLDSNLPAGGTAIAQVR